MKKWLRQLKNKTNALALRERVLVFLAVTTVLFMLWNLLLFAPQHAEREALNLQMQTIQRQLGVQAQEASVLASLIGTGTDANKMQQLTELEKENASLNDELAELALGLVPADDLLNVLKDVLEQSSKLTIRRIESLPPEELKLTSVNKSGGTEMTGVINHAVVLSLEGSYFGLLDYLQGLEQLPWRFYWDSLKYRVSGYPLGNIELKVSTLTVEETLFEN